MRSLSTLWVLPLCFALAGCAGGLKNPFAKAPELSPVAAPVVVAGTGEIGAAGVSAEALDTTTSTELAQAAAVAGGAGLGETVASLGDPTQPGLWLRTPLVTTETPGRIEAANGQSLAVTLIPIAGEASAGSRISLAAMRGLGLGLTDLPSLRVFRVSAAG